MDLAKVLAPRQGSYQSACSDSGGSREQANCQQHLRSFVCRAELIWAATVDATGAVIHFYDDKDSPDFDICSAQEWWAEECSKHGVEACRAS
jgi:hypothetical protein